MKRLRSLHRLVMAIPLATSLQATAAVTTAAIVSSSLSPECLDYKVVGIYYWLFCTPFGCKVKTSVKVRHYVPDAVVSSYANTGGPPWTEVASFSPVSSVAAGGNDPGDSPTQANTTISARFKNADVIGHPGGYVFSQFASGSGYTCKGAGTAYMPYLLSNYDYLAWRYGIPEVVYPEALIPGKREVGSTLSGDLWGNVYPRSGFLHQPDDYKAAAVMAQRAGDVVTRSGQIHVYQPLLAKAEDGYWPAGALVEGDASTGKWQELTPSLSQSCAVFPNSGPHVQDTQGAYAWALWRPYSCCKREGQVFLGSTDFQ